MTKVAEDYGVTGTALKKSCKRHKIPTPTLGYWAKLQHGKRVVRPDLPKLDDPHLQEVRIRGSAARHLPDALRAVREQVQDSIKASIKAASLQEAGEPRRTEPQILLPTRRAISKARPDSQGFVTVRAPGIVSIKVAPRSLERALEILTELLALAEVQGFSAQATEQGLGLVVQGETIAFGLIEQSQKTLHEPTLAELKERDRQLQWGSTTPQWPKYDQAPSGKLSIVIEGNSYSGLRRTYSDGQIHKLVQMLPEVLVGFSEHAALAREHRLAQEERDRTFKEEAARRDRQAAFDEREKRRMDFVEAVQKQLSDRATLTAVLSHIETAKDTELPKSMIMWLRRRIQLVDDLISPLFLDLSARSGELDFQDPTPEGDDRDSRYFSTITLKYWSIDEEKVLATAVTPVEWATRMI